MLDVVFYLVIGFHGGATTIPEPMTEVACRAEAARINRPSSEGGLNRGFAACIRVERIPAKK